LAALSDDTDKKLIQKLKIRVKALLDWEDEKAQEAQAQDKKKKSGASKSKKSKAELEGENAALERQLVLIKSNALDKHAC
jgi:hypothetical protein